MTHLEKKIGNLLICTRSHPGSAKVTSIVCDGAVDKMEKWLSLSIYQMTINLKSTADSTVVRLKVKEIYGYVISGKENVKPFLASAGCLHVSKGNTG